MRTLALRKPMYGLKTALHGLAYPRLCLYDANTARGDPWTVADTYGAAIDSSYIAEHMPKFDLVIIQAGTSFSGPSLAGGGNAGEPGRTDILAAIRAANPRVQILAHVFAQRTNFINPGNAQQQFNKEWRAIIVDEDAVLRNGAGVKLDGTGTPVLSVLQNVNIAKYSGGEYVVARRLAALCLTLYNNTIFNNNLVESTRRFDGLFVEGTFYAENADIDFVQAGYANQAAFTLGISAAMRYLAATLRAGLGDAPLIGLGSGDGGDVSKTSTHADYNGWMREDFPDQNGGTWASNMVTGQGGARYGYLTESTLYRQPFGSILRTCQTGYNPATAEHARKARWGVASAALANGSHNLSVFGDPTTAEVEWEQPWDARSWGHALTPYRLEGGLYVRDFQNGRVRVNPGLTTISGVPGQDAAFS